MSGHLPQKTDLPRAGFESAKHPESAPHGTANARHDCAKEVCLRAAPQGNSEKRSGVATGPAESQAHHLRPPPGTFASPAGRTAELEARVRELEGALRGFVVAYSAACRSGVLRTHARSNLAAFDAVWTAEVAARRALEGVP